MEKPRSSAPEMERSRLRQIMRKLYRTYPDSECALVHSNALELMIATILSAQCTDVRVNIVTTTLFKRYKTVSDYAGASLRELQKIIRSSGFFRAKANSIREACRKIVSEFNSEVPSRMEDLVRLPGVGRKTANVILGTWFRKASGVVVDTHVHRISRRLGMTSKNDPVRIEQDLMEILPRKDWIHFSHMVIWHGRRICTARKPKCRECPLTKECPAADNSRPLPNPGGRDS